MVKITPKDDKSWVTFTFSGAKMNSCMLSGSWNDWAQEPMKQKKSGEFYLRRMLPIGSSYEFGYLTSDNQWHCDDELGCITSPFGSKNSLLEL